MKAAVLLWLCLCLVTAAVLGFPLKYDKDKVYVHVVPHTHDDVGWLKTVDEYYYGSNKTVQLNAAVQYILDTVIQELQLNESRTFSYVEIAFFSRWWKEQTQATKDVVKQLVAKKQFEFVNAGWCMNDEATTHYNAIIDQMTLGLRFVEENFGAEARPRVAWHIDPFGHSSGMATLLAQMGFDAFFFARNDYMDYSKRVNESTLQMVWRSSSIFGSSSDLFTGILYNGYGPPHGFCFDHRCADDPVKDNPDLFDYNVDYLVEKFIAAIYDQKKHYLSNHIMLTMGSDFQYENAREVFKNLDKLMMYTMEKNSSIVLFYSTPSRYVDALNQANLKWTVKTDDFFPYADHPHAFWTGYFTSRPALKGYVREMNSLLQVCKQMEAFAQILGVKRKTTATTRRLKEAMGVVQHHDAVSGTERQHVADDYAKRLHIGSTQCQSLIQDVVGSLVGSKSTAFPAPQMVFCEYLNASICSEVEAEHSFNVLVYNPLMLHAPLTLWIPRAEDLADIPMTVLDDSGNTVTSQVQTISLAVQNIKRERGVAKYELVISDLLPPLTFRTYFVRPTSKIPRAKRSAFIAKETKVLQEYEDIVIGTEPMQVTIDGRTGRVKAINNTASGVAVNVDQSFNWYISNDGLKHARDTLQNSGAYIFRPNGTKPLDFQWNNQVHDQTIVKGDIYTEYRQQFNETVYQTVRVYHGLPFVEFDYVVGPIYFWDSTGKEVVSRFTTDLQTNGTWYTDANGREMQKRIRDYRATWKLNKTEPVSQNYYPVNSRIYMKDEARDVQFTVFTDRSQGGSSLNDGQLELMVHRRIFRDDDRGVAEPLDEPGQFNKDGLIIRGRHYVLVDTIAKSKTLHRTLGEYFMLRPHPIFILDQSDPKMYKEHYLTNYTFVDPSNLPSNVHLLTFEVISSDSYLLRLENFMETGDDATISLSDLFRFKIETVVELTLGANAKAPIKRIHWATYDEKQPTGQSQRHSPVQAPRFDVTLSPMVIRSFQITVKL